MSDDRQQGGNGGAFGAFQTIFAEGVRYLGLIAQSMQTLASGTSSSGGGTVVPTEALAKGWIFFNGVTGANLAGYNVASIVKNSTGNYTVTWTIPFSSVDYVAVGGSSQNQTVTFPSTASATAVQTLNSVGANADASQISLVVYGAQ